jgi:hypothetical protein
VHVPEDEEISAHSVVVLDMLPDAPVTVMLYAPVVVVDVVATVSVDVCADVDEIDNEVEERLHVAGLVALGGLVVTAQLRLTVPVKEFVGVTVIVAVALLPGLTEKLPLLESVKLSLVLFGFCQNPAHPARKGVIAHSSQAQCPTRIAAPNSVDSLQRPPTHRWSTVRGSN